MIPGFLLSISQNELRYVEPGNEAEIFMEMYPGRIIKCKVDSILWATAQGQMPISGNLAITLPNAPPEERIAVRLLLDGKDKDLFLAAGARGQARSSPSTERSFTSFARFSFASQPRSIGSSSSFTKRCA